MKWSTQTEGMEFSLTVSSVTMAWICVQNMIQVNREKRNPSNTPNIIRMKTRGPGRIASQPGGDAGEEEEEAEKIVY